MTEAVTFDLAEHVRKVVLATLPAHVRGLVEGGVITVDAHVTYDGCDIWSRSTQPHPKLGVGTHESYDPLELAGKLSKVNVPLPVRGSVNAKDKGKSPGIRTLFDAKVYASKNDVTRITKNGVANILPTDSLCYRDFEASMDHFQTRSFLVAEKIGLNKLRARIASDSRLSVEDAYDLGSWWQLASANKRFSLLSTNAKLGKPVQKDLQHRLKSFLEQLNCPFQDTEVALVEKEESVEETDSFGVGI